MQNKTEMITKNSREWEKVKFGNVLECYRSKKNKGVFKDTKNSQLYFVKAILFREGKVLHKGQILTKAYIGVAYTKDGKMITSWQNLPDYLLCPKSFMCRLEKKSKKED